MIFDYIIVGQGISGTFLSWELMRRGKRVLVIDEPKNNSASKVASGVINPVTGRRVVRTWEIETLMPYAVEAYSSFGKVLGTSLIRQCNILDFHATVQMKMAFQERMEEEKAYLKIPDNPNQYDHYFNPVFGVTEIDPCWLIHIHELLSGWRNKLKEQNALLEEKFILADATIGLEKITYQSYSAQKIIFCDGTDGFENPYFKLLPYARNKGQALTVSIPDLPPTNIYKQGISIVPWKDGLFWVGSSYEWDFEHTHPTSDFKDRVTAQLRSWLKLPFAVEDHIAAERPANMERRPFVGLHPVHTSVGVFNGMGTKGCSLAPYFAHQFANHLIEGSSIHPQADVQRFRKILSR